MDTTPGMNKSNRLTSRSKRLIQGAFFLLVALAVSYLQLQNHHTSHDLNDLFKRQQSNVWVEFEARVVRLLADDNHGSRHQRFIVENNQHTVLIAHNIDLAPKVPLAEGDIIRVKGEYEWNEKGGVVHWTHHDPQKKRADGWIELNGKKFK